jgi:hypothetical protein
VGELATSVAKSSYACVACCAVGLAAAKYLGQRNQAPGFLTEGKGWQQLCFSRVGQLQWFLLQLLRSFAVEHFGKHNNMYSRLRRAVLGRLQLPLSERRLCTSQWEVLLSVLRLQHVGGWPVPAPQVSAWHMDFRSCCRCRECAVPQLCRPKYGSGGGAC